MYQSPLTNLFNLLKRPWRLPFLILATLLFSGLLACQLLPVDFTGWQHGFNHPLEGWDHLITMLAVGIWAAQMRGHTIWMLPLAFVSVMSLGGLAGASGLSLPSVEGIVLASTAVFGILICRNIRFNNPINLLIVTFFAFFHGFAHGQEISASASLLSYTLGFTLATLLLHGAGILVAKLVVLTLTCLCTLIFAQASSASSLSSATQLSTVITLTPNSDQPSPEFSQTFQQLPAKFVPDVNIAVNAYSTASAKFCWSALSNTAAINQQTAKNIAPTQSKGAIYTAKKNASAATFVSSFFKLVQAPAALNLFNFNKHYPNINNSPGTSLLSNGVGLTSPPLSSLSYATSIPRSSPSFHLLFESQDFQTRLSPNTLAKQPLTSPRPCFARCLLRFTRCASKSPNSAAWPLRSGYAVPNKFPLFSSTLSIKI